VHIALSRQLDRSEVVTLNLAKGIIVKFADICDFRIVTTHNTLGVASSDLDVSKAHS